MAGSDPPNRDVVRFPLVGGDRSELNGLEAVLRRLVISVSIQEVMEIVTQAARTLLHADGITFVLREGDRCYYAEEDAISPLWKGKRFPMEACISGWCMTNGKGVIIPDIYADARIPHDAYRPTFVRSLAMAPVGQDTPIAAVGAYWSRLRETTSLELELLQALANAATLALSHVELRRARDLEQKARSLADPLHETDQGRLTSPGPALPRQEFRASSDLALSEEQAAPTNKLATSAGSAPPTDAAGAWPSFNIRPHSPAAYGIAITCVLLATLVRLAFGSWAGSELAPFATYFPAVLIATLIAGAPSGIASLVLGGALSWWAFMPPAYSFAVSSPVHILNFSLYVIASIMILAVGEQYRRVIRRFRQEQGWRVLLHHELRHRLKDVITVAQAIVSHSLEASPEKARKINRRLAALTATNSIVGEPHQRMTNLKSLVASELEPYGNVRVEIKGQHIGLWPELTQALALAFHELATNAVKYGALSVPDGRLAVSWSVIGRQVRITWSEQGGPSVAAPKTRGFGTTFIERVLADAGATIAIDFRPEGLVCSIRFTALIAAL